MQHAAGPATQAGTVTPRVLRPPPARAAAGPATRVPLGRHPPQRFRAYLGSTAWMGPRPARPAPRVATEPRPACPANRVTGRAVLGMCARPGQQRRPHPVASAQRGPSQHQTRSRAATAVRGTRASLVRRPHHHPVTCAPRGSGVPRAQQTVRHVEQGRQAAILAPCQMSAMAPALLGGGAALGRRHAHCAPPVATAQKPE